MMKTSPSKILALSLAPAFALALSAFVPALAHAAEWELDPSHSKANFTVKHMMVTSVHGVFDKTGGTVDLDDKDPTKSKIEIDIDAASINTAEPKRDAHLKSPDFFDVAKNPKITFVSTKIEKAGKGKYKVTGDLTMRGVTKPVTLAVTGPGPEMKTPFGTTIRPVSATGKINRKDWGLTWNKTLEAGGVLVGDEVQIDVEAELLAKAPAAAAPAAK